MKTLKFNHQAAQEITNGQKTITWRLYDDKELAVNDEIKFIDKLDPDDPISWKVIGTGKVKQIVEKNLGDVTLEEMEQGEGHPSKEKALQAYQTFYGKSVNYETPVKIISFNFTPSTGEEPSAAMLLEAANLFTDGGSRGNPGQSACAFVICNVDNTVVEKSGYYIGIATNNQAEYLGFKKGLERARDLGIRKVNLHSDSQLVVNQMKGIYKVKNQELAPLHAEIKALAKSFEAIEFTYVPREYNKIADAEVNRILDEQERARHHKKH
jgi:ribonuclease HI